MGEMMPGMMGAMWIWWIAGVLLVIGLVIAIVRLLKK